MQTHSVLLRIVALALLFYSLSLFGSSMRKLTQAEAELSASQIRQQTLEEEQSRLEAQLQAAESGEGMEKLARDRLGLVMPEERIFYFTSESVGSR